MKLRVMFVAVFAGFMGLLFGCSGRLVRSGLNCKSIIGLVSSVN